MLTNEQIDKLASENTGTCEYPSRYFLHSNTFARAIESAATAPLLARIAELEAKLAQQDAQPVMQWQKKHPMRTDGWENTDEHDAKWWRDNSQGWEIRAKFKVTP